MKKYLSFLFLGMVASGCSWSQDFQANQYRLNSELTYICSTGIGTSVDSVLYGECRMYYDKVLFQYDIDIYYPWDFEISNFSGRTRQLVSRCSSYSKNPENTFFCVREQEDMMLAEHVRKKILKEEQNAKKELMRERAYHEKQLIKEREKQHAKYNPKPEVKQHEEHPKTKPDRKHEKGENDRKKSIPPQPKNRKK